MLSQSPFGLSKSQHRLETVSLSQALSVQAARIDTGLDAIDDALGGGICVGQVTEIYGAPGSGKTAMGMHLAAEVLMAGGHVTWLESSQPVPASRLLECVESRQSLEQVREAGLREKDGGEDEEERRTNAQDLLCCVKCISTPDLTSLLSLLFHAPEASESDVRGLLSTDCQLLVIDDLTTLFSAAFPPDNNNRDASAKRARVLTALANCLSKLAITHNIAVVVLCKLTSKIIKGGPAQLEGPFGDVWSNACACRLLIYRDHYPRRLTAWDECALRWIAIQKTAHRNVLDPIGHTVKITGSGFVVLEGDAGMSSATQSRSQSRASQRPPSSAEPLKTPIAQRGRLETPSSTPETQTAKRQKMSAEPAEVVGDSEDEGVA